MRSLKAFIIGASLGALIGLLMEHIEDKVEEVEDDVLTPQTNYESPIEPVYTTVARASEPDDDIIESDGIQTAVYEIYGEEETVVLTSTGLEDIDGSVQAPSEPTWMDELDNDKNYKEVLKLLATTPREDLEILRANQTPEQAWHQYVAMRLSDVPDGWIFNTMYALFEIKFEPIGKGQPYPKDMEKLLDGELKIDGLKDYIVYDHIIEAREEFFGNNFLDEQPVTIAELFLYFGELMEVDFGDELSEYLEEMLNNVLLDDETPYDFLVLTCKKLENHVPIGRETDELYGIFGTPNWVGSGEMTSFLDQYYQYHGFSEDF